MDQRLVVDKVDQHLWIKDVRAPDRAADDVV